MERRSTTMGLAPGDRVDRYLLRAPIGEGGQGEVWRAEDPLAPGEERAVKLVPVASASSGQLERVRREARQLVQLQHPSLVRCHGMFEDLHCELLGIVMEYQDADALQSLLPSDRLTPQLRLLLLAHVAGALAYVHQRGVIHRDVKLENVLVTRGFWTAPDNPATVKLIDFGIAVESMNPRPLTQTGSVIGTPPYLAPERLEPEFWQGSRKSTPTSDVFAWGILAWKLVANDANAHPASLPSGANLGDYAVAYRRARGSQWPPFVLDPAWHSVLTGALALEPARRIANGLRLVQELGKVSPSLVLPTAHSTAPTAREWPVHVHSGQRSGAATEPTGSQTHTGSPSVRTVPGAPPQMVFQGLPAPQSPRRARSPSLVWGIAAGVTVVLTAVLLAVALAMTMRETDTSSNETLPLPPMTASPSAHLLEPSEPLPEPQKPVTKVYALRPCPDVDDLCTCCPSGFDCLGAPCSAAIHPTESFLLRAAGGRLDGRALHEAIPGGKVCVRLNRNKSERCTPVEETEPDSVPSERLPILWRDIASDGIVIEVKTRRGETAGSTTFRRTYTRGVFCDGMIIDRFDTGSSVDRLDFFVDPPTGAARCCKSWRACK